MPSRSLLVRSPLSVHALIGAAFVAWSLLAPAAKAHERYTDGCINCHGAFMGPTSPTGSVFPNGDKHFMHNSSAFMGTNCNLCHVTIGDDPLIGSSAGTANNPGVGCTGCHGRDYGGTVGNSGVGLRAHHAANGITMCAGCHPNDPTPLPENVKPTYYGTPDTNVDDPCNTVDGFFENWTAPEDPNGTEGLDNDGNNLYDGDDPACAGCPDEDGDGFDCETDCDDADPNTYPGAPELCDGLDNDCDGTVPPDEIDDDGDGFAECEGDCDDADPNTFPGAPELCNGLDNDCDGTVPADEIDDDGDGFAECNGDCNDGDPAVFPGAEEICDGVDNDCNGEIDEIPGCGCPDDDGDGFTTCDGDCDDGDGSIYPGAPELCNGVDDDCDGVIPADEIDGDGDGFAPCAGDCDDGDAQTFPGAVELCDGFDNDCNGMVDDNPDCCSSEDFDGDGFTGCDGDCNDADPQTYPGAIELCDGIDNDCDGTTSDEPCHPQAVTDCSNCHLDPSTGEPDLVMLHDNDCGRCHPGFDFSMTIIGPVGTWNHECSACHTPCVPETGIAEVPTKGHRCVACHGGQLPTWSMTSRHRQHIEAANCVVCHGFIPDLGTEIGSGNRQICAVCHEDAGGMAGNDLQEVHRKHTADGLSCLECHGGARPPVDIVDGSPVGSVTNVCQVCHDEEGPSDWDDELHEKHTDKHLDCGSCHLAANLQDDRAPMPPIDDPVRMMLDRSGTNECSLCHGGSEDDDSHGVHREHVADQSQWCYNCHQPDDLRPPGLAPPVTTPAESCILCHDAEQYDDADPFDVHERHAEKSKCYACHQTMPPLFDWPVDDWLPGDTDDCDPICATDVNDDGQTSVDDLIAVLMAWGQAGGLEDVDGSGFVDIDDLLAVLAAWGACG